MEEIELHPINTRVVCLNQPHLRLMWVFKALAAKLGCYYNNHLLQVISSPAKIELPNPKTVKLRGHASHIFPTEAASLNTILKTGTYIMFYVPENIINDIGTSNLIISGIESVSKSQNPTEAVIQIIDEDENDLLSDTNQVAHLSTLILSPNMVQTRDTTKEYAEISPVTTKSVSKALEMKFDFKNCEKVETLVEEEENIDSGDDSDCLDDLHKIIRYRLAIDISSIMSEWKRRRKNEICVFLLKPVHENQSWQFKSVCISTTLHCNKENAEDKSTPRKAKITRKKPVSSPDGYSTLNTKRKINQQDCPEEQKSVIHTHPDTEISVF